MLTLRPFPVLLRVFLLVGMLIWPLLILKVLVLLLMLPVGSVWRVVLVRVGIFLLPSWLDTPDSVLARRPIVLSRMRGIFIDNELGVVPEEVVLALRDAGSRSSVDDFWTTPE